MYQNVLIPMDLSEQHSQAMDDAVSTLQGEETSITLLHVIEQIQDVDDPEVKNFYDSIRAKAESLLSEKATELSNRGLRVKVEITFGKRGAEILRYANTHDIDLMIIRGHTKKVEDPRKELTYLSQQLALFANCSVLLTR
ncbi:MAG: universal stress protein [Deltaproteobacteria bacterium]|nr:universal stress protein [Deltaproteobacteria bacterium]